MLTLDQLQRKGGRWSIGVFCARRSQSPLIIFFYIVIKREFYGNWCSPFLVFNRLSLRRLERPFLGCTTLLLVEGMSRLGGLLLYAYFEPFGRKEIGDVLKMRSC